VGVRGGIALNRLRRCSAGRTGRLTNRVRAPIDRAHRGMIIAQSSSRIIIVL
jgi:hypothetical protein